MNEYYDTLEWYLVDTYPQYRHICDPIIIDDQKFILVNSLDHNDSNLPIYGKLFQCHLNRYGDSYQSVKFKQEYISIETTIDNTKLIGKLKNGQTMFIVYNKQTKLFEEE